jgi:hypothetical protein
MHNIILKPVLNFLTNAECDAIIENNYDLNYLKKNIIKSIKTYFISEFKGYTFGEICDVKLNSYTPTQKYSNFKKIDDGFLSFMIQLNDNYEEGFFQFSVKDDTYYYQMQPGKGHMIVFFSNLNHRTIPVTSGIKYTLTGTLILKKVDNYIQTVI